MATEVLEGFSPGVLNALCVTQTKILNNRKLEQHKVTKSEPVILLFSKVTLKATAVNSDS